MKILKKATSLLLASIVFLTAGVTAFADDYYDEETEKDIYVFFTNDVHNAYEQTDTAIGYASLAADIKKTQSDENNETILVDAGDSIQGGIIGALSKGMWPAEIMDKMGYDVAVPGNHEFDFGVERFLEIADSVSYDYVCCNFIDLRTGKTVFMPYKMIKKFNTNIAFVGITTPETYRMSNQNYFRDENGNDIYSFCGGDNGKELYKRVQDTINDAKAAGADIVIAVAHTGIDPSSTPWTTGEIIANVSGLDGYIDGHSHTYMLTDKYTDKDGKEIAPASTGSKFEHYGTMYIEEYDNDHTTSEVTAVVMEDRAHCPEQDTEMLSYINSFSDYINETAGKTVATSDVTLYMNDPSTGNRLVRQQETNLGDFCADAYLNVMDADIAFINGGGLRADITKGDITIGDLISAQPFGNLLCTAELNGQTILDLLEMSVQYAGDLTYEAGNFQHVAGITFDVDTTVPSPVITDENRLFVKIDGKRRVNNVKVGEEPIDPDRIYTVASHNYLLKSCGGGFTMLENCKIVKDETVLDYEALITYITDYLGGNIAADSTYTDPYGQKRIRLYTAKTEPTCEKEGSITYLRGAEYITEAIDATGHSYGEWTTEKDATYTEEGVMKRICSVCGNEETKTIPVKTPSTTLSAETTAPAATTAETTAPSTTAETTAPSTTAETTAPAAAAETTVPAATDNTTAPSPAVPGSSSGTPANPDSGMPVAVPTVMIVALTAAVLAVSGKRRK